jgi:lysozyme
MSVSRVPGIDVSRWQRRIDWSAVADAGYRFAFIRATIGDEYTDPRFYLNWDGARETEMLLASYHVLRPDVPPDDQIDFLVETLGERSGDLPPVLDIERDDGMHPDAITASVAAALEAMEAQLGRRPIVYTARWCWNRWVRPSPRWRAYDLWVASYTSEPRLPRDWDTWLFWQYTDRGDVPGVQAPATDLNWFAGSWQDLQRYAGRADITDEPDEEPAEPDEARKSDLQSP